MALILFPSNARIARSDLELVHPGQVVLKSVYGSGSQVMGRGPGYWRGRIEIAETDRASDAGRRAVELFLAKLRGSLNTFEVPLHRGVPTGRRLGLTMFESGAMSFNLGLEGARRESPMQGGTDHGALARAKVRW